MKLVTVIVSPHDSDRLIAALVEKGYQATRLGSTGGFLRRGNATLLIGVDDHLLDPLLEIIRTICRSRTEIVPPPPSITPTAGYTLSPIEVRLGGAVVLVQNVEHFEKT